jgi:septin family protein
MWRVVCDALAFPTRAAGETGLGKSTFINALFAAELSTEQPYSDDIFRIPATGAMSFSTAASRGLCLELELCEMTVSCHMMCMCHVGQSRNIGVSFRRAILIQVKIF